MVLPPAAAMIAEAVHQIMHPQEGERKIYAGKILMTGIVIFVRFIVSIFLKIFLIAAAFILMIYALF